ncbi:uncharacterized protein EI90DRAFT_3130922 [Cantharellus anzutake]|uniref:uncharacterized protein n=1 Tax=Cantharellus anzutake TaxID=1750568 RepID=UPI001902E85D|nr:uncharacterized protein EI90DRAFT_3130922 [Cantharellus anzutake]KAF8322805.1 hypothetical protein EI90DRAFT_3130922 [Cantharellus anzutake]
MTFASEPVDPKEPELIGKEIITSVKDNPSQRVKWTIHRPVSGWYIRIRSPHFAPKSFVSLVPCNPSEGDPTTGALAFTCQTRIDMNPPPPAYSHAAQETPSVQSPSMSYPPQPSASSYSPVSSSSSLNLYATALRNGLSSPKSPPPPFGAPEAYTRPVANVPPAHIGVTRFVLKPASIAATAPSRLSFFSSALKSSIFGAGKSFTIQASHEFHSTPSSSPAPHPQSAPTTPVLAFRDTTPLIGAHSTSGIIELDHGVARVLGVDLSWWISVALAYIDFLDERDGYQAASDG